MRSGGKIRTPTTWTKARRPAVSPTRIGAYRALVELLAHWWNGSWGTTARRDVWVEQRDDGRFQVRDRDGRYVHPAVAAWAVQELLGDMAGWQRMRS
jgi:hypothetical protein